MKWIFGLIVIYILAPGLALRAQDTTQVRLQVLIHKMLVQNPQLQSARSQQQSANAAVSAAGTMPDPVLGFNIMSLPVNSFSFHQAPMTGKQITLMQRFPFPGKLNIIEDIAQKEALIKEEKVRELRNQLIKQLKKAYYNLFYVDRALGSIEKSKKVMKQLVSIAETHYSVGKGLQQDVLRAQLELTKLMDKNITFRQKRSSLAGKLNTLIDAPPDQPVGTIPALPMPQFSFTLSQLKAKANERRPLLAAWQTVIDQSKNEVVLAKKQIFPDFSVGVGYTQRDKLHNGMKGYDFLSAMFKINLPVFFKRKQNQQVQKMKLMQRSDREQYRHIRNEVYQHLQDAYTKLQKNKQLVDLYRKGAIPQAKQSFKSTMSAYQNGKVDFHTLLDSELSLFHMRLSYYRAVSDYNKNLAKLEAATGINRLY
jgi:outer membrane protein TolC